MFVCLLIDVVERKRFLNKQYKTKQVYPNSDLALLRFLAFKSYCLFSPAGNNFRSFPSPKLKRISLFPDDDRACIGEGVGVGDRVGGILVFTEIGGGGGACEGGGGGACEGGGGGGGFAPVRGSFLGSISCPLACDCVGYERAGE